MPGKLWNEIAYPFANVNGASLGMDKKFYLTHYNEYNFLSMLWLRFMHFSEKDPVRQATSNFCNRAETSKHKLK